ncbi:MAG: cell division protein FtsW [Candidatus Magasanikbacteria bacterium RIFOXYD2_FULL_41_14]|uniref:Probable peptidoglycan glycosyltransferase FtsW n=1 Tax=Candidatus Magasanikbacteria bacterium RIFOXYD2_FULL_41_14 TaxID=1798709 RepID=A0A1F6PFN4_9BACT|nr:MAG: cell division protein FtsW [Candidatus Magasanikbacteria bacterium RIFOXYD2_FULL_41_14]
MNVASKHKADTVFISLILIIVVFGLVALTSASGPSAYEKFGDSYFLLKRQIVFGLLPGLVLFFLLSRYDYERWKKLSWLIYGVTIVALLLVFLPNIGLTLNGARSWVNIGPYSFQPAEIAKLGVIMSTAYLLASKRFNLDDWQTGLIPVLAILFPPLLLILLQPDIGTLSILVVILFCMLYVAKVPINYLIILGLLGVTVFGALIWSAPYRVERLTIFLHPELDPQGIGYHINQAFLAIGSGGFWGLGLGHSRQKFQYLPEVSADSIYAVMAEELGFVVAAGFIILILVIGWRGLRIAKHAPDEFGSLIVVGVITWFVCQSFLNIGAMVGIMPLTGVPLPFVSHGGSALAAALAGAGIIANVSRQSNLNH